MGFGEHLVSRVHETGEGNLSAGKAKVEAMRNMPLYVKLAEPLGLEKRINSCRPAARGDRR